MLHPAILCRAGPGAGFSTIHTQFVRELLSCSCIQQYLILNVTCNINKGLMKGEQKTKAVPNLKNERHW